MDYSGQRVQLDKRSKQLRRKTINLALENGGYHFGGSFSCVEILRALYEDKFMSDKDRFILSKGHACWPWYVLLKEAGYNPKICGHPSRDPGNGILCTTGSLGHGLPQGIGMSLAKKQKKEDGYVYVLMGDGELQEGTTWESMLIASHHKLSNLIVIVDWNNIQGSGYINDTLNMGTTWPIFNKAGWQVHITDGHNIDYLRKDLNVGSDGKPKLIAARTVKGAGVSFMENEPKWHACWPSDWQKDQALKELT